MPSTISDYDHLNCYANIDITIDTFPYNGTTTTAEALLMGTPVACILGNRHASRVSASILTNIEEQDWIAADADSLVKLVFNKASDIEQLVLGRLFRRQKYLDFNNATRYARDFETLIEQLIN